MKEKKTYCCGCCSEDETDPQPSNRNKSVRKDSEVIQMQPLSTTQIRLQTQKVYYWEGFRAKDEEIRPLALEIVVPTQIAQICGTENELVFVLEDGSLWTYDRTDGVPLSSKILKPRKCDLSGGAAIDYVVSGKYHTLALDKSGNIYSWGSNRFGQVGLGMDQVECEEVKLPQLVKLMASKVVVQIAAGGNHSVLLVENGDLYSCGSNSERQLGLHELVTHSTIFTKVPNLGLAWGYIAAGGNQTYGVTIHNSVFVWGDNAPKQKGIFIEPDDENNPAELTQFDGAGIIHIATGKWHTLFTGKGESCKVSGSNRFNQVGPPFNEGMITQVATGEYHSVILGNGKLYSYGPIRNETEIDFEREDQPEPTPVTLPTNKYNIFAFLNATFIVPLVDSAKQNNIRDIGKRQILQLSPEILAPFERIVEDGFVEPGLERRFKEMSQITVWNGSFKKSGADLVPKVEDDPYFGDNIDFLEAERFIQHLWSIKCRQFHRMLITDLDIWLDVDMGDVSFIHEELSSLFAFIPLIILNGPKIGQTDGNERMFENVFLRLLKDIMMRKYIPVDEPKYLKIFAGFLFKKATLKNSFSTRILDLIYYSYSLDQLQRLVGGYKRAIVSTLMNYLDMGKSANEASEAIRDSLKVLKSLHSRNEERKRISHHCFIIPQINKLIDLEVQFTIWMQQKVLPVPLVGSRPAVYLCDYPFILDGSAKAILLQCEQKLQMLGASFLSGMFEPPELRGFVLLVKRENLLEDVLRQIFLFSSFDFKKPLRIQFSGEEGQDAGGVRKEFFLLLIRELLDFSLDRGLLKKYESHLVWFTDFSGSTAEIEFLMVFGVLAGLAIYNNTIIKLPFPSALYKKLLGEKCEIEDLVELSPTEGNSLKQILEYKEADLEQVFSLTFELSREDLGLVKRTELVPGGKNVPLTLGNKSEFAELYVDHVFNESVESSFTMFSKGFELVFNESLAIKLFRPEELKEIIIGNEDYDWGRLVEETEYKGVFHKEHKTIEYFWEVFDELSLEQKKQFLLFLTGSDRVPISGMSSIQIFIQSVPFDETYFPVAHTCFNLLDLPVYQSKERLREKLLTAIEHKEGFYIA